MSGKRFLKKQQKREATALAQLAELYRKGADDDFLCFFVGTFRAQAPLSTVQFAGQKPMRRYVRFMQIGFK